ncbi:MAG: DUF3859 domain-containing protein [Pseudomonadota bacterium]
MQQSIWARIVRAVCVTAALTCASAASAQRADFVAPPLAYLGHGLMCQIGPAEIVAGEDTVDGEVLRGTHGRRAFDVITARVPARTGISFGVLVDVPAAAGYSVMTGTVLHPPMGADGRTVQTWQIEVIPGTQQYIGYGMEDAFEEVTGTWVFQVWGADGLMMQHQFQMVPDGLTPDVDAVCRKGPPTS